MEKKIESNSPTNKLCSYFGSRNGCRTGDQCDFDHSQAAQAKPVVKVPKLCRDGEGCVWTPRCGYVHPAQFYGRSRQCGRPVGAQ